jgi:hypothetical protein
MTALIHPAIADTIKAAANRRSGQKNRFGAPDCHTERHGTILVREV